MRITDYCGRLVSIEAPDRSGRRAQVLLGFGDAVAYAQTPGSFGALLGRNANRIADATMLIDGHRYHLSENEDGSTLHGGAVGFDKRFWSVGISDKRTLSLTLHSADGDQGFPGDVEVIATYHLRRQR